MPEARRAKVQETSSARAGGPVSSGLHNGRAVAASAQVARAQRARLLAAVVAAACEEGVANVTVTSIGGRARTSRRTFYELFENVEDCLRAAFENALQQAHDEVVLAWQAESDWRRRIRAALAALLALFDRRPQLARLLIVEWPAAGAAALEHRFQLHTQLARAVEEGRGQPNGHIRANPSSLTAEGLVGAVAAILHARLLDSNREAPVLELLNPLVSMIVLPYLGAAAARRELAHPPPAASAASVVAQPEESQVERLGVRITYRTVSVLRALAEHPRASNRLVACEAGVIDQGQMSKLLHRLQRAGLVENRLAGSPRGTPNAWMLTAKGQRIERSLRS